MAEKKVGYLEVELLDTVLPSLFSQGPVFFTVELGPYSARLSTPHVLHPNNKYPFSAKLPLLSLDINELFIAAIVDHSALPFAAGKHPIRILHLNPDPVWIAMDHLFFDKIKILARLRYIPKENAQILPQAVSTSEKRRNKRGGILGFFGFGREKLVGSGGSGDATSADKAALERFLSGIAKNDNMQWKRVKLIILGDAAAGKSSMLRWLTDEPFENLHLVTDSADVECVDIHDWTKCKEVKPLEILLDNLTMNMQIAVYTTDSKKSKPPPSSPPMKLPDAALTKDMKETIAHQEESVPKHTIFHTWDFAGQEVYYATHNFFLSSLAIYMLVLDVSKPMSEKWLSRVCFWLYSIRTRAEMAPILIVGTHLDLVDNQQKVLKEMKQKIGDLIDQSTQIHEDVSLVLLKHPGSEFDEPIFGVSCKHNNEKKLEVRNFLKKLADHVISKMGRCPPTWMLLMERIFGETYETTPATLSIEDASQLAGLYNVTKDELFVCLQRCHDLGFVLYYRDDPTLSDVIFVDPKEVVKALRTVLTARNISKTIQGVVDRPVYEYFLQGKLTKSLLQFLWRNYNKATHSLLKQLLVSKFYLAVEDIATGSLIIPYVYPESGADTTAVIFTVPFVCTYTLGLFTPMGFVAQLFVRLYKQAELLQNQQSTYCLLRNAEKDMCQLKCENTWVVVGVGVGTVEITTESVPSVSGALKFINTVATILLCIREIADKHKAPRCTITWKCTNSDCGAVIHREPIPVDNIQLLCDACAECREARVLFAESNPPGTPSTLSGTVLRELENILHFAVSSGTTWETLQLKIEQIKPTILHIWAHGERDGDVYRIVLSDNDQLPLEVQMKTENYTILPTQLAELIKMRNVGCVVFSVCHSAPFVEAVHSFAGSNCVGFEGAVSPRYMERWSKGFYQGVVANKSFHECVKEGFSYLIKHPVYTNAKEDIEFNKFKASMVVRPPFK